jgi:hypothetical protein
LTSGDIDAVVVVVLVVGGGVVTGCFVGPPHAVTASIRVRRMLLDIIESPWRSDIVAIRRADPA